MTNENNSDENQPGPEQSRPEPERPEQPSDGQPSGEQPSGAQASGEQPASSQPRLTEEDYVKFTGRKPKMTRLDYEADPLARLERNNRSTKQAIIYFLTIPAVAILLAVGTVIASQASGGPYCDRDASAWLCSDGYKLFFYIAPAAWSFIGLFGAVFITYYKWSRHLRWRPWIAVIWFMMPITIGWTVNSGAMLALM